MTWRLQGLFDWVPRFEEGTKEERESMGVLVQISNNAKGKKTEGEKDLPDRRGPNSGESSRVQPIT